MVLPRGFAPQTSAFARRRAELLHFGSIEIDGLMTCAMPEPPRRSRFGMRNAKASLATGRGAVTAWRPAPQPAVLAVTPMTLCKVVAAFGIAPNSPRFQRGANLSQLYNRGPSARYRPAFSRLSGGCSAFELRRNEMVARRGNAPRSTGCRPAALLLSYRAKKSGTRTRLCSEVP